MPKMDLGDVTIHYQEAGEGEKAFVHCHGLGGNGDAFIEEFDFWKTHFGRVVTWDNRGLGQSSGASRYSLPLYASDLSRLLERLGIEKAVIHGVSWGGIVVQQFALDYQWKCSAIIIDSSSSEVNLAASENWYQQGEDARYGRGDRSILPRHLDSFVAQARATAGLREHPITPRLSEIACPTLIVGGGQDFVAGAAGSVLLGRNIPEAKTEIIQDSGHGVYSHKKDEFRRLVLSFCKGYGVIG